MRSYIIFIINISSFINQYIHNVQMTIVTCPHEWSRSILYNHQVWLINNNNDNKWDLTLSFSLTSVPWLINSFTMSIWPWSHAIVSRVILSCNMPNKWNDNIIHNLRELYKNNTHNTHNTHNTQFECHTDQWCIDAVIVMVCM